MKTNISDVIDIIDEKAKYDACVKELLADKQILAMILKYSLDDFVDDTIEEIISYMDEPKISTVPVNPTHPKMTKVPKSSEEDSSPYEGAIYYDIRFSVYHLKRKYKILINIEAQKTTDSAKLGYHIENRAIYYISRMISSQKNTEFTGSDYDDIKAVRSIWICMDGKDGEDSIESISLTRRTLFGGEKRTQDLDKMQVVVIKLREKSGEEKSKNILIAMLEELFGDDSPAEKKRKLAEDYALVMEEDAEGRIQSMCNWSDNIWEKGMAAGREEGMAAGREEGMAAGREEGMAVGREETLVTTIQNLMDTMRLDIREAMDALRIPMSEQEMYIKLIQ